ncbi:retrovirus-related pol polyprotein from transposon TNT 1-94 [Tanacetum coccineum]
MSKSTKPHPCFYNNDYFYLVDLSTKEKYTTSITKHYVARYYKEATEDRIPERWSTKVRRYHFEALNGIHHWEENIIDFFKAGMCAVTKGNVFSDLRIKSVLRIDVKKKWGYSFLTSITVRRSDDKRVLRMISEAEFWGCCNTVAPRYDSDTLFEIVEIVLWYLNSGCSKHITGHRDKLINFVFKFIEMVRFGNDHFAAIMGYGDLQMGNILISHVYYIERLGRNLFSVGEFCDLDLKVAFRKHTCFVRNLEGVDLLSGSHGSNLYTISMVDMMKSSLICLLSKASNTNRRLSHLNFSTINKLAKQGLVKRLPKLKYNKDHLCSACQMGKARRNLIHIIRNRVKFLRTKNEALEIIIKFLKQAQVSLIATVRYLCTDNGTEFLNQTLRNYTEDVGITHMTSTVRTSQLNSVVERRNCTLVEAARTMLIFSKSLLFLWAKAIATACYTQNRSLIHTRYNKTPYELLIDRKPELKYLHVFGALCYPTNNFKDLGKLQTKADIGIVIRWLLNNSVQDPIFKNDWDLLFQPMFDEYFKNPCAASNPISAATLPPPDATKASSSSSTSIDKDAPFPSTLPNIKATIYPLNSTNLETNEEVAMFDSDTFTNPFAPLDTNSAESSSRIVDTSNMHTFQQPLIYTKKMDKRSSVTKEELKNYKKEMEESCWIEAMQEEIHEFERLEV